LDDVEAINLKAKIVSILGWYRIDWHDVHDRILLILGGEVEELLLEVRANLLDLKVCVVKCDNFVD
jgi:hypothetical protein